MIDNIDNTEQNSPSSLTQQLIKDIMEKSFIDYAMSVITSRALPDVRDGLKPVHRRILWAMHEAGNLHSRPFRKSARMVGDVIGKYHPHGDVSVYDAATRMTQPFSMNAVLIEGQGNFGSIDNDPPAAMRYTEMRLSKISGEFFDDLLKDTVAWRDNYDGSESEPEVLTAPFPNLLVNGTDGIAVGMATSIPPHNLRSVADAALALLANPEISDSEIAGILKAPDFPTGGIVHDLDGFLDAVTTGRGRVRLRAQWHVEERGKGLQAIVLDEIPFKVIKSDLVSKISELVRDKQLEGIVDIRDESNKEGVRVWIAVHKESDADVVIASLLTKTDIEVSISYNCVVLDEGKPVTLGLRKMIERWIAFRDQTVLKRHQWERRKAQERLHILEGFMAALGMLDQTIAKIRAAADADQARQGLQDLLSIDEVQARAILELRLQRLTGMELEGIRGDHAKTLELVQELGAIIADPQRIRAILAEELRAFAIAYGNDRQTEIGHGLSTITRDDLIPREDVLIMMTRNGYIKRMPVSVMGRQNRGTRGKKALDLDANDYIMFLRQVHSHDDLLLFSESGKAYAIKAHRIPEAALGSRGRHIKNVVEGLEQQVHAVVVLPETGGTSVVTVTHSGQVKRSAIAEYIGASRSGGIYGVGLDEGDRLCSAFVADDEDHIMLVSSDGNAIRFVASDVRLMGRTAGGVRGMRLGQDQSVVGAFVIPKGDDSGLSLMCLGSRGVGKRTAIDLFGVQNRAGSGMLAVRLNQKTGSLVSAMAARDGDDVVLLASNGVSNRIRAEDMRLLGRATSGVVIMNIDEGHTLVSAATAVRDETSVDTDEAAE